MILTQDNIEEIKLEGSINALRNMIQSKRHDLEHNIWQNFASGTHFTDLAGVLDRAEELIGDMRFLLDELQQLEPENK